MNKITKLTVFYLIRNPDAKWCFEDLPVSDDNSFVVDNINDPCNLIPNSQNDIVDYMIEAVLDDGKTTIVREFDYTTSIRYCKLWREISDIEMAYRKLPTLHKREE